MFTGKTLLITGGTGSFGNIVTQTFLNSEIEEIRIFSRDEKKQDDMRKKYNSKKLKFHLGDIRDKSSIGAAMSGVDYVFSAAALKQVPSCEFFPMEAVRTNVEGVYNTIRAAVDKKVKKVICLSTDKAVYPINAMGISKAMMEKMMIAESRNCGETTICGTRYGNVMCSRGSVIPLFIEQIRQGKPLTVTDPDMTRFLMSLKESVALVMYVFNHGNPGDRFVQKAPACKIGDLAIALKELFHADNPIEIIGSRHGEKLYESLLTREEMAIADDMGDYYRIPADNRDLNYSLYLEHGRKNVPDSEYNSNNTIQLDIQGIQAKLMEIPEVMECLDSLK